MRRGRSILGRGPCPWYLVLCTLLSVIIMVQSARCAERGGLWEKSTATIDRPTTAVEVWRNLKFALDNDLFLRDEFYTDENLRRFFAATQITWQENLPTRTSGRLFSPYLDIFLIRGTFDEKGNDAANGKKRGGGTISADVTADLVIEVFGKPMKVTNPYAEEGPEHPSALMPKTHHLGNLSIEYSFDHQRTTASLSCRFNGDGTVKGCGFGNTEK
jgi:hypothetical protein